MTRPRLYQVDFDTALISTTPVTLSSTQGFVRVDTTAGNITLNLPAAASSTDRAYYVVKVAGANDVIVNPDGVETINGAATYTISTQWEGAIIVCNGTSWTAISGGVASHAAVTLDADAAVLLDLTGQEIGLDTQTANTIFAGPTTGAANEPTFRALVLADLPAISLDDLSDVTITTPQDGAALVWDDVAGEWVDSTHIRDDGDTVELGDPTDHIEISTEGEVTLVGTSRVLREIRIEAGRARPGASAPTQTTRAVGASGNVRVPVDQYSKTTQNDTHFEIHAPSDMDGTEPVYFHLMWFPGASWTAGNYMWKLEYIVTDETGVELNAEAPTTISASVTPTAATNVIETEFTDTITFDNEQLLWCHFYRDVANDNGDDTGDVRWFEIEYVMNKFGEKYTIDADALLLESGDHLLLESGDRLLLEV